MKTIKYKFLSCEINHGSQESPNIERIFLDKEIRCETEADYEANLAIAEKEALNGEYTVEDDGTEETEQPTQEERLTKLETAVADLPALIQNAIKAALANT